MSAARRLTMGTEDGRPRRRRPAPCPLVAEVRTQLHRYPVDVDALWVATEALGARPRRMRIAEVSVYAEANAKLRELRGSSPGPVVGVL